jgi:hypothetical protein
MSSGSLLIMAFTFSTIFILNASLHRECDHDVERRLGVQEPVGARFGLDYARDLLRSGTAVDAARLGASSASFSSTASRAEEDCPPCLRDHGSPTEGEVVRRSFARRRGLRCLGHEQASAPSRPHERPRDAEGAPGRSSRCASALGSRTETLYAKRRMRRRKTRASRIAAWLASKPRHPAVPRAKVIAPHPIALWLRVKLERDLSPMPRPFLSLHGQRLDAHAC